MVPTGDKTRLDPGVRRWVSAVALLRVLAGLARVKLSESRDSKFVAGLLPSASHADEGPIRACLEGDDRNSAPQAGKKQWGGRSPASGRRVEAMRTVAWARASGQKKIPTQPLLV
ncbi:hypothetical protein L1887_58415 [Cichorium endivia]|nr:hypothetical protein L1887_58415 [Cichorium endivia]